jgi:putative two-component system response regulator
LSGEEYLVLTASNGQQALKIVERERPDLVILEVVMPGMNGYEVCKELKEDESTRFIPVVMITALTGDEYKVQGIEAGADDFLQKPFNRLVLLARVRSALRVKSLTDELASAESVIYSLALAIEEKDPYTRGHSLRVSVYSVELGQAIGLSPSEQEMLRKAALLHDVGMIGIDEKIVHKPGPLTPDELAHMKEHAVKGEKICEPLKFATPFLPVIRHHHEWWNGQGYPDGLSRNGIPLGARIIAIADAFDAMTSQRPYRVAMSVKKALTRLEDGSGRQWDPDLINLFIKLQMERFQGKPVKITRVKLW